MILGIGNDLVDLDRFRGVLKRTPTLVERLFTASEREYALRRADPTERFAVRFAAKEATLKALGVGIGAADWHEIEVRRTEDGRPSLALSGRALRLAEQQGVAGWELTLSHSGIVAQAVVVALGSAPTQTARVGPVGVDSLPRVDAIDGGGLVPIVTPVEMAAIDRAAPEPVELLIDRAGGAVARAALTMLGGAYGRRVVVLAGKGNNGNDGRNAARRLASKGVRVTIVDAAGPPEVLPDCDLVIDAAYGTGFRGEWNAPLPPPGCLVLAVDIPSGIDGLSGSCPGDALHADATVSFAALKPGNIFDDGLELGGELYVADIGLATNIARAHLVGAAAVASWLPEPVQSAHKWQSAVWVVAGSPGMTGAATLCAGAAARTGAGYVRVSTPGGASGLPIETVATDLPLDAWAPSVIDDLARFHSLVIGNGLGVGETTAEQLRQVVAAATGRGLPTVVDADGLTALGTDAARFVSETTVLTPHDGEFARLAGHRPGPDRIAEARALAEATGAVVLLKGRTTVVAAPDGEVLVSIAGDQRLATAGTGDVLAGIIGALLACGLDPLRAAGAGAFLHGRAGALGWRRGLVASDVIAHLPAVLDDLTFLRP